MIKLDQDWEIHGLIGDGWGEGLVLVLRRDPFKVICLDLPTYTKVVKEAAEKLCII